LIERARALEQYLAQPNQITDFLQVLRASFDEKIRNVTAGTIIIKDHE